MAGRPRKARSATTARRVVDAPPQVEAPPVAGAVPIPTPDSFAQADTTPTGRARRSYKAEVEDLRRRLADQESAKIDPKDFVPVTGGLLNIMAASIKGDGPTEDEVQSCNVALVNVANKYGATFKYWEEVLLFLAFGSTAVGMRQRAKLKASQSKGDSPARTGAPPPSFEEVISLASKGGDS